MNRMNNEKKQFGNSVQFDPQENHGFNGSGITMHYQCITCSSCFYRVSDKHP